MILTENLVHGADVWINTPRRPWEASGTSGMKTLVNGGINLSELDGWWAEAYSPEVGWAIGEEGARRRPVVGRSRGGTIVRNPRTGNRPRVLRSGFERYSRRMADTDEEKYGVSDSTILSEPYRARIYREALSAG